MRHVTGSLQSSLISGCSELLSRQTYQWFGGHRHAMSALFGVTRGGVGSQLSVAVGDAGDATALHSTVTAGGTPAICGAVVSRTVTTCAAVAALPQRSVEVHVRVSV